MFFYERNAFKKIRAAALEEISTRRIKIKASSHYEMGLAFFVFGVVGACPYIFRFDDELKVRSQKGLLALIPALIPELISDTSS